MVYVSDRWWHSRAHQMCVPSCFTRWQKMGSRLSAQQHTPHVLLQKQSITKKSELEAQEWWQHCTDPVNSSARGKSFPLSAEENQLLLDCKTYSKNLTWVFCYGNYVNISVPLKNSSTSFDSTRWMKHHPPHNSSVYTKLREKHLESRI